MEIEPKFEIKENNFGFGFIIDATYEEKRIAAANFCQVRNDKSKYFCLAIYVIPEFRGRGFQNRIYQKAKEEISEKYKGCFGPYSEKMVGKIIAWWESNGYEIPSYVKKITDEEGERLSRESLDF